MKKTKIGISRFFVPGLQLGRQPLNLITELFFITINYCMGNSKFLEIVYCYTCRYVAFYSNIIIITGAGYG